MKNVESSHASGWRGLYPFRSHFFETGSGRLHYVDEGQGETLLFVHGNPTWSFYWRNLIGPLRDNYRCLAVDHLGCGLSDKPQDYDYCLERHTRNLAALVEHLDARQVTLLAHDWGGAIGLGAVLAAPHRFARLVLFNTGAFPPPFVPWRIAACRLPGLGTVALRGLNLFARAALRMAVEHHERMTPDVRAGLLAPYDSWAHRIAIQRFVADIPFSKRHRTWQVLAHLEERLPALNGLPSALIWGMRDWCFRPNCLERIHQSLTGAERHEFPDAGHYVIEDAHERIVPLLRSFLTRHAVKGEG